MQLSTKVYYSFRLGMETLEISWNFSMENKMVQYLHPTPQGSGVSDLRSSSNTTQLQKTLVKTSEENC